MWFATIPMLCMQLLLVVFIVGLMTIVVCSFLLHNIIKCKFYDYDVTDNDDANDDDDDNDDNDHDDDNNVADNDKNNDTISTTQ